MRHVITALVVLAALSISASASAQQALQFCFTQGVTSGVDSAGGTSRIGVRIGGIGSVFVSAPVGTGPSGLATLLLAELQRQGYGAAADGPDCVCVLNGPGGAPIQAGGGIGSTDTGVRGVRVSLVRKPLMPPPQPPTKTNGVVVPAARPGANAQQSGQIVVDVEVERVVNGQPALVTVQVVVTVNQGDTQQQIDQKIENAIQRGGLKPKQAVVPHPLDPSRFMPGFLVDTDQQGNPVVGIHLHDPAAVDVLDLGATAGAFVDFGATQFGRGFAPTNDFPLLDSMTPPVIGRPFDLEIDRGLPNAAGGIFISPPTPPIPLPFLGPDAFLFVDPAFQLFAPGMSDPLGHMGIHLPLPPDPQLVGLDLMMQGLVIAPPSALSPGVVTGSNGLQVAPGR